VAKTTVERSTIEASRDTVPVFDKEVSRITTGIGYRKDWHTKLQSLLHHDLCMLFT
jgi:hypothetical protein